MQALIGWLIGLPWLLAYLVAGLIVLTEPALLVGVVMPSVSSMVVLGFMAHTGAGVQLLPAVLTGIVAAVAGDSLGYLAGCRWRGRQDALVRRVGSARWAWGERWFLRYGTSAVFGARWLMGARTLVPRMAALSDLPYRRFLARSAPSGVLWGSTFVLAGYLAGRSYLVVIRVAGLAGAGVLAALVLLLALLVLLARRRRAAGTS